MSSYKEWQERQERERAGSIRFRLSLLYNPTSAAFAAAKAANAPLRLPRTGKVLVAFEAEHDYAARSGKSDAGDGVAV